MLDYRTLESAKIEDLHQSFIKAFCDYEVKIDLPLEKFQDMLVRNGFVPELSIGAFKDDSLIGFILNGFRDWNGMPAAYDSGTGVVPEFRRQGITTRMFEKVCELLQQKGIEQYLLEVIKTNTKAVDLYKKQGFSVTRDFLCFTAQKADLQLLSSYKAEYLTEISSEYWDLFAAFCDYHPSWQNAKEAVLAMPDKCTCAVVKNNGVIAGYGIINKQTGGVFQLAVHRQYRCKGVGSGILSALLSCTESPKVTVINIDSRSIDTCNFLYNRGFACYVEQYEMMLKL